MHTLSLTFLLSSILANGHDEMVHKSMSNILHHVPTTMTSLIIDNCGAPSARSNIPRTMGKHFCSLLIGQLVAPHLRHLRIRSRNICPEILKAIASNGITRLETLIISLNMDSETAKFMWESCFVGSCTDQIMPGTFLYWGLADAAKEVVPLLPTLKTLRIMCCTNPAKDFMLFDALCGTHSMIPLITDWKAIDDPSLKTDNHFSDYLASATAIIPS